MCPVHSGRLNTQLRLANMNIMVSNGLSNAGVYLLTEGEAEIGSGDESGDAGHFQSD